MVGTAAEDVEADTVSVAVAVSVETVVTIESDV
jgi:hypothetical protein